MDGVRLPEMALPDIEGTEGKVSSVISEACFDSTTQPDASKCPL